MVGRHIGHTAFNNDHVEWCLALGAGFEIAGDDLHIVEAREIYPRLIRKTLIGLECHDAGTKCCDHGRAITGAGADDENLVGGPDGGLLQHPCEGHHFDQMARSLRTHSDLLLNWFHAEGTISSGSVEGLNNKAKLIMRKAYGFRTENAIRIALFHGLGKLPQPKFTHDFY